MRVVVEGKYTYETNLSVALGSKVLLPNPRSKSDSTWVGTVTALTSTYTGPCRQIVGFAVAKAA